MRTASKIVPPSGVAGRVLDLHSSSGVDGIPTLVRLSLMDTYCNNENDHDRDYNDVFGTSRRVACLTLGTTPRGIIPVVKGLGSWMAVSCSSWDDSTCRMHVPFQAFFPSKRLLRSA